MAVYAVRCLTVVRMLPVAVASIGMLRARAEPSAGRGAAGSGQ